MKQTISVLDIYRKEIQLEDLKYVEGNGNYSILHLKNGRPILLSRSVSKLEHELAHFVRIHKRHLVNPHFIADHQIISGNTMSLSLTTGETLTVARRRMPQVMAVLDR